MKLTKMGQTMLGQDGAIWGDLLFRFDAQGRGEVYDLSQPGTPRVGQLALDSRERVCPHCNSAMFGTEYFAPEDQFPLLYCNIYNNCYDWSDRMEGTCCVYRIWQEDGSFRSRLVQLIRVGFAKDPALWMSGDDARPYGNFVIDREKGLYYGFTMRTAADSTRYFAFRLPGAREGTVGAFGVPEKILTEGDILSQFDCPYHRFLQGACCHRGKIYSVEGFTDDGENRPALRIIDPAAGIQEKLVYFSDLGQRDEPELIDFRGDQCWYSDCAGQLFLLDLEEDA